MTRADSDDFPSKGKKQGQKSDALDFIHKAENAQFTRKLWCKKLKLGIISPVAIFIASWIFPGLIIIRNSPPRSCWLELWFTLLACSRQKKNSDFDLLS